MPSSASSGS